MGGILPCARGARNLFKNSARVGKQGFWTGCKAPRALRTFWQAAAWPLDGKSMGSMIHFADGNVIPHTSINKEERFNPNGNAFAHLAENPNQDCAGDGPDGATPETWWRRKVDNLEVEGDHTGFVDTLGTWVHDAHRGRQTRRILWPLPASASTMPIPA